MNSVSFANKPQPKFGSAAANNMWLYAMMQPPVNVQKQNYLNQNQPQKLPNTTDVYAPSTRPVKNSVRFGLDPLTLMAFVQAHPVLSWFGTNLGASALTTGINSVLSDMNNRGYGLGLESSRKFVRAKGILQDAESLHDQDTKKEYLRDAEKMFVGAAAESSQNYKKAEYYKYAAIVAEMSGRNPQTIRDFADLALRYRSNGHDEIASMRRTLQEDDRREDSAGGWAVRLTGMTLDITQSLFTWPFDETNDRLSNNIQRRTENFQRNLLNQRPAAEIQEMRRAANHFDASDCYSVCSEIKRQAEQAIERNS